MNLGIGMEIDSDAQENAKAVQLFIDQLAQYVSAKNYGNGMLHYTIGFICIKSQPGFEDWHKSRKPKFSKLKTVKRLDGTKEEMINSFTFDIKLSPNDYDSFISCSPKASVKLFAEKLLSSLNILDEFEQQFGDFQTQQFKSDLQTFISGKVHCA